MLQSISAEIPSLFQAMTDAWNEAKLRQEIDSVQEHLKAVETQLKVIREAMASRRSSVVVDAAQSCIKQDVEAIYGVKGKSLAALLQTKQLQNKMISDDERYDYLVSVDAELEALKQMAGNLFFADRPQRLDQEDHGAEFDWMVGHIASSDDLVAARKARLLKFLGANRAVVLAIAKRKKVERQSNDREKQSLTKRNKTK